MKTLLKFLMLALTLAALFLLIACGDTPEVTTNADTTTTEAVITTEAEKTANVFVNGETDYVLVYDDSVDSMESLVKSYVNKLKSQFGLTLTYKPISKVTTPYEHEIIVGDLGDKRPSVNAVKANCKTSDFAVSVQNGDVVLYATNEQNYRYLFAALIEEAGLIPTDKNLTYTSDNDYYYHASSLKEMNYLEYKNKDASSVNTAVVKQLFTYHETQKPNGQKLVYRLYVPSNYDPEKEYPLLVFLHGAGEVGVDNEKQFGNMILEIFKHKESPIHDAIVLLPQCPSGNQWVDTPWANGNYRTSYVKESDELKTVMTILSGIREDYSVDAGRIYATGISMGGFGTWDLLMRHPDVFAAGIPVCGGADVTLAPELAKLPIRTFHSADDTVVPPSGTRAMAEAIKNNDPVDFTYTEFPSGGHDAWTRVGKDLSNWEWLFSQKKTSAE